MDFYIQKILANPDSVKARTYSVKIQDTCKLFLIVLEDYLRFTFWSNFYNENTNYTCFEIFKDYYEDANFHIDRNKLFRLEEDVWNAYSNQVIMIEDNNPGVFNIDNYGLHLNFLSYDLDLDLNFDEFNTQPNITATEYTPNNNISGFQSSPMSLSKKYSFSPKSKKLIPKECVIKFTKRENVDKKIIRKFRKFLKDLLKKNKLPHISEFWIIFIKNNLLPPVQYSNSNIGEEINFKSFNTNYLLWLFSHDGGIDLFNLFKDIKYIEIIEMFTDVVKTQTDEYDLRKYLDAFAMIYSCKDVPFEDTVSTVPQQSVKAFHKVTSKDSLNIGDNVFDTNFNE
jgi:hypothetical protein